jgi:hypothetical protein
LSTDAAITVAGLGESASKLQGAETTLGTADLPEASTGAPRTEKKVAIHKSFSDAAAFSTAPPASSLLLPTLCTRRDLSIPQPPAAGAAGGGEESGRSPAARWAKRGVKKVLLSL